MSNNRTRSGPGEHNNAIGPTMRNALGALRRMAVKLTTKPSWQLLGHLLDGVRETPLAEVFSGIGFYARPRASDRAEAAVIHVGGASQPIIVATRNEDVRRQIANISEDETAVFNSQAILVIKANGTVEIRAANGVAVPLVTRAEFLGHGHLFAGTGAPSAPVAVTPPGSSITFPGTSVLKGQ